jgi:hypothetical protein
MPVGKKEKKALQARNFSAHGLYVGDSIDYEEQKYHCYFHFAMN